MARTVSCCRQYKFTERISYIMGNTGSSSAKAHAQALNWEEDSVPEGAWVVSVWLESIKGIPSGISGDLNQLADPYVTFKLSKCANGTFGPQPQRSSFRKYSLNPTWRPPEKFTFVVDAPLVASGKWPSLQMEIMDYDLMTSDDIMAETFFALSDLDAIKKHKAASVSDAAKSATAPTETAADEDEYVSGGVPLSLAARNPKTGDVMKGFNVNLRVAAAPKKVAFDFKMHTVVEYVRWTPDKGWNPVNRIHGDPRHFALEAYHGSTGRANALPKAASSANVLASPPPPPPPDEATRCQSESQSNVSRDSTGRNGSLLAGAAPGAVFSADDFNTVAGLLDAGLPHALRHEGASSGTQSNSSGGAGGGGGVHTVQQWAVIADFGDADGWQYCATFSPRNTDWYEKPSRLSFCKRRFWRRKLKIIANASDSAGASVETSNGLPPYDGSMPIRVGWMNKRKTGKAFRTRYFVLWPRALVYYEGEPPNYNMMEFVPAGAINLRGATVQTSDTVKGAITVMAATSKQVYTLAKQTSSGQPGRNEDLSAWLDSLTLTIEGRYTEAANVGKEDTCVDARMSIGADFRRQKPSENDGDDDEEIDEIDQALDVLGDSDDEKNGTSEE